MKHFFLVISIIFSVPSVIYAEDVWLSWDDEGNYNAQTSLLGYAIYMDIDLNAFDKIENKNDYIKFIEFDDSLIPPSFEIGPIPPYQRFSLITVPDTETHNFYVSAMNERGISDLSEVFIMPALPKPVSSPKICNSVNVNININCSNSSIGQ